MTSKAFRIAAVALLGALSACATSSDRPNLAVPAGEWRQMNAGRWQWDGNEIAQPMPGSSAATGIRVSRRSTP